MSLTSPKTGNLWGFGAKVEAAYGTKLAPTTSDGVLLTKPPAPDFDHFLNDGARGNNPMGGKRVMVASSGRWGEMKVEAEGIGAGAAYAAGVKPHLDAMILGAGHKGTGSFTGGQESWVYTPSMYPTDVLTSLTLAAYLSGQLYTLYGAYGDVEIAQAGPDIPNWMFDYAGVMDAMTDVALPVFSNYPAISNLPQKGDAIGLTIGTYTAGIVKSFAFKAGRSFKNHRVNVSTGAIVPGYAGLVPGNRNPTLEVVIDRDTLAATTPWHTATTLDPYRMAEDNNQVSVKLQVGSVQYKRWGIFSGSTMTAGVPTVASTAILEDVKDTFEGPNATWTLTFGFFPSTYVLSDDYAIYYN